MGDKTDNSGLIAEKQREKSGKEVELRTIKGKMVTLSAVMERFYFAKSFSDYFYHQEKYYRGSMEAVKIKIQNDSGPFDYWKGNGYVQYGDNSNELINYFSLYIAEVDGLIEQMNSERIKLQTSANILSSSISSLQWQINSLQC